MKTKKISMLIVLFVSMAAMAQAQQSAFQGTWIGERGAYVDQSAHRLEISGNSWQHFFNGEIQGSGTARFSAGRAELLLANGSIYFDLTLLAPGLIEQHESWRRGWHRFRQTQPTPRPSPNTQNDSPLGDISIDNLLEVDGWALVENEQIHYYLYLTNENTDIDIFIGLLFFWAERQGYIVDYDNVLAIHPNENLAPSVIRLMESRFADISVTIHSNYLYINLYMGEDIRNNNGNAKDYSTLIYPLARRR